MKILHVTSGVGRSAFGVSPVILGLVKEQQRLGNFVQIWHTDTIENEAWAAEYSGVDISTFRCFPMDYPRGLCCSSAMEKAAVSTDGACFDILHHHGMWQGITRASNAWRNVHNKPTIIAPHGMLEPIAIKQHAWKKTITYLLFSRNSLIKSTCFHACSDFEFRSIRRLLPRKPVAVIPNAVDDSWLQSTGDGSVFRERHSIPENLRVLLYVGRLAPIKGLETLLKALPLLNEEISRCVLVIVGSGAKNYVATLRSIASGSKNRVCFVGPLYGQDKRDAFDAANMFVLPSHSENFGIAAAEALGAMLPVIATTGTPWEELVAHECGWWVKPDIESIAGALDKALAMPDPELKRMGMNGQRLVSSKYSWGISGKTSLETYEWILNGGAHPECIRLGINF